MRRPTTLLLRTEGGFASGFRARATFVREGLALYGSSGRFLLFLVNVAQDFGNRRRGMLRALPTLRRCGLCRASDPFAMRGGLVVRGDGRHLCGCRRIE